MKTANVIKAVCAAGLTAACVWTLAGCASTDAPAAGTGGVAATVNGTDISEDSVTAMIESIRTQSSLTSEDSWGAWLAENDMTPESVREQMIDSFVQQELIKQGAQEKGITVEDSELDGYVDTTKANYDSDEKWQQALEGAGFTEEEYRDTIEYQLYNQRLQQSFASDEDPSQEDLLQYAQMYATSYAGAKRSSHILFASDDEATAQSVLDQINSGQLDFAEAAQQYSIDTTSAENGGDVGWSGLNTFVTEYQTALDGLEKDQVSGLVTSTYGIHIIKCTDVFTAPEEVTSTDQVPVEFLDDIKTQLKSQKQSEAYQAWYTEYEEAADIVINEMPEGLPYDLDMSKYQTTDDTEESDGSDTADTSEDDSSASSSSDTTQDDTASGTTDETDGSGSEEGQSADGSGSSDSSTGQIAEAS